MTVYDNTNSGALFKAKKDKESWPDYTGSLNVEGVDYWVSGWLKKSKDGKCFMSLSIKLKESKEKSEKKTNMVDKNSAFADFDDDIPF